MKEDPGTNVKLMDEIVVLSQRVADLEKRHAEIVAVCEVARKGENRYRQAVEATSIPMMALDSDGTILWGNMSFQGIAHISREEADPGNLADLVIAQQAGLVSKIVKQIFSGGHLEGIELTFRGIDGTLSGMIGEALPVRGDDDTVLECLIVVKSPLPPHFQRGGKFPSDPPLEMGGWGDFCGDESRKALELNPITYLEERRRAEEALKESEEKYRFVVEHANEAIFVAQDGILKFVNPKAAKISKYTPEELTSKPFISFVHFDDREKVGEMYSQGLSEKAAPGVHSFRIVDKTGTPKWLEINAVTINWEGRPAALIFGNDVSARRQMEEELLRIEKLESLGILAGGIAHDFNNILTAILGNISLARLYGQSDDKATKRLKEAEKACLQAQGLTIQLLTFAKGGVPVKKTARIGDIIEEAALFSLRGSNVRPEFAVPDDLWTVEVDEAQISQVTNNLIINADHAMPDGGIVNVSAENMRVTRELGLPLETGRYVKITIQDHGVGIPDQIISRIFDPYFTTKSMGCGLGLATSYSIIRNHGGLITVESEPNAGTTFHILLPASEQHVHIVAETEIDSFPTGKGHILLMDDEAIIRELAVELLSHLGYDVEVAEDGVRTVELYRSSMNSASPFDVVILDLTVPGGMGGRETIQRLLEIDAGVKAVVSSGYANDPILADYVSYGFMGVVSKPYTIKEISETLNKVIGDRKA